MDLIEALAELAAGAEGAADRAAARALAAYVSTYPEKGRGPEGEAWARTQDGRAPLRNVASALRVERRKGSVALVLSGHYFFHDRGTSRTPKRQILPDGITEEIANDLVKFWKEEALK